MEIFHYSPKRCLNLKEIQKVLDISELKIVKPSDTRWLSHEKCVSTVKKYYGAIVSALETIYQESHELEALGISKILSKPSTLFVIYLLDYILPEVSKLSKSLQTEKLGLSISQALWMLPCTLWKLYFNLQLSGCYICKKLKRRWILL